jgi:hypothetical protein
MKRRRPGVNSDSIEKAMSAVKKPTIMTPKFRELKIKDIKSSSEECSPENTDNEYYEDLHAPKEKIEILLRQKADLRKIKANGRSTNGIHKKKRTERNF